MSGRGYRGDGPPRGGGRGGPPFRGRGGPPGGDGGGPPRGRGGYGGPRGGGGASTVRIFAPNVAAEVDARLTEADPNTLIRDLQRLTISRDPSILPPRPGWGRDGEAVKLRTNYYPVKIPKRDLYEYNVAISPNPDNAQQRRENKRLKKRIFQLMEEAPAFAPYKGCTAHDSSAKLYSAVPIQNNTAPLEIKFVFRDEEERAPSANAKRYTVTITFSRTLSTVDLINYVNGQDAEYDPAPLIAAINIILAKHPNTTGGYMVGKNRFFFPQGSAPLGGGLVAYKGFYSSVRPVYRQLMVNVNVATTAFYVPQNLLVALEQARNASFGGKLTAFCKGVKITTTHLGYKARKSIKRVMDKNANQIEFDCEEYGGKINVTTYFKKKYNITLRSPGAPVIDVGATRPNYLPPELCDIMPGQSFKGRLSDDHTAEMIKIAANPPDFNANAIQGNGLRNLGYLEPGDPNSVLPKFNIGIGNAMAVVPGRILPAPQVAYGGGKMMKAEGASWNLKDIKFQQGATLSKWAVVSLSDRGRDDFTKDKQEQLKGVILGFMDMCKRCGMNVNKDELPAVRFHELLEKRKDDATRKGAISGIRDIIKTFPAKPTLILFLLSNADKHIYSGIKHICDTILDVHSVCVHAAKIKKEQVQYYANVALKFNMKLGGVNHSLHANNMTWLSQKPTMVVGMDVTHPGPGSLKGTPSIAAVVASVDTRYAQYPASLRLQESKKEMIDDLTAMMVERLIRYREMSKKLPERILVYRDGVSEGQFQQVVDIEYPAIRAAFRKVDPQNPKYSPKVTIAVCGKRHHTRFYPTSEAGADRTSNTKAGTVVDKGVTTVYNFDFFLQAHAGLQGTVRPTHYIVVVDENKFGADDIQKLTHDSSYMFARATKGVSLVAPAYYADLACERGRCYIHELLSAVETATTSTTADEEEVFQQARRLWGVGPTGSVVKNSMFYL